jgi:hypothetical protein
MNGILISLVVILGIIASAVLFLIWKIISFKNKVEDIVIDSIKEVIVTKGPEAVKYVNDKIKSREIPSDPPSDTEKFNEGFDKPIPPQSQIIKEGQDPVPAPPKPNNIS